MEKVIVLDIKFQFGGIEDVIHPVVLKDGANLVLVDCRYTDSLPAIERAMEEKNLSCRDLTHVLITHQDHGHMGTLAQLKKKYPRIQAVASKGETSYISGRLKSLRLAIRRVTYPSI